MREELVENGLKFLQHPNVQSTPLSERVSFLEGKGMTKEEIQESIERHQKQGSGTTVAASAPNAAQQNYLAPPMMMNAAAPMQMMHYQAKYPAYVRVLWTISSLVGAASILTFLWNYAVQSGYIPWLRPVAPLLEAAKVQKEKEQEAKKDEALLAELSSVSSAIQKQTEELTRISSSLEKKEHDVQSKLAKVSKSLAEHGNARAIAELKAEVSTLKMLMFSKTSDGVIGIEDIIKTTKIAERKAIKAAAMVNPQQPPSVVSQMAMKAEQMEKTLKKIRSSNLNSQQEF
ncbi:hypothetical protein CCR75_006877 [Bremia lactucae]|uniref:Peroxisomal membrane protein PEX14 n=1 Tax=Bremia lactucae TaxID=4779 RepID=A0A976ILJ2_BRELC|nr:hypothetical protein CCR75_006877 [Bremia lactucae]